MNSICLNGKIIPAGKPVLMAGNRSYRYGDGLFETMKVLREKIILQPFHFERLFNGFELLRFEIPRSFTERKLVRDILLLCKKNKCENLARVRLSVFRGNGGLYDENLTLQYLIECRAINENVNQINKRGLSIDVFPDMQKNADAYSNLKSANFLPYVLAAQHAQDHGLDDCLVCNTSGHIADATIANIFLVKNNLIITPALSEGCVSGVMRKYLIQKLKEMNFDIREGVVTKNDLETFDEVFLTNAVSGMRWVKKFRSKKYHNTQSARIFKEIIAPLYI